MSYWAREIAGWVLVLVGLYAFYEAYDFLLRKRIFEAMPLTFVGFVIFRGGIHMLKVAVAAQAARHVQEGVSAPAKRAKVAARPLGPTAPKNVLPGPRNPPRREGIA
jgi:hypothetical protein